MRWLFITFLLLPLSGCGYLTAPDNTSLTGADRQGIAPWEQDSKGIQATSLYSLVDSPELRELVNRALAANPDLQQTALSLQILQTQLRQTRGAQLPQLEADLSASKAEDDDDSYSGALSVSWTLDIWGKLSDTTAAAKMDIAQQQELLQAAKDTLAAQVMEYWLELICDTHAAEIQRRRVATYTRNENYITARYRNGLDTLADLDSARSSTASAKATLVEYQENVKRLRRTLQVLLGSTTALETEIPATYPAVLKPIADLPEQTMERRPDLRAAYYAIQAADLTASASYKELLPEISLSAALEDISDSPSSLLLGDPLWSLLGSLTAPLFQGGALRAQADAAELEAAQSYQAYRQTLLTAMQEVEDSLAYEKEYSTRISHIESALKSARNSFEQYQKSYRSGLVDILDLLTVEKETYDLELELDELTYKRLANRIELGLALGLGITGEEKE